MASIRQTLRSLWNTPGFSVMAIVTMALGIAVTTALFSLMYAALLQPLAFPDADRVVAINTSWPTKGKTIPRMTGGDYLDLRSALKSFEAIALYGGGENGVRTGDHTRFAQTFEIGPEFFRVLGVTPAAGRLPGKQDANRAAVLTVSFARATFGDAGRAIGQDVIVNNKPYDVIAVLPDQLSFPEKAEVWITGPVDPDNQNRSSFNYHSVGRVRPGISLRQAEAELSTVAARLAIDHPDSNEGKTFRAIRLQEQLAAPVRSTMLFLFGAAGLLLLISCANAANLMLARASARTRETAIRVSLGSGVGRIVRILLAEGVALGGGAAILGLALAYALTRAMLPLLPANLPHAAEAVHIHGAVLLFAVAVSCMTAVICSLVPAASLQKVNLADVLKQSARGFVSGGMRSRNLIVVAQIALCCILCVGAALLSRTLVALINTPLGFRSDRILVMYANAPAFQLPEYMRAIRTFETALGDIRNIAGVESAATVMGLPTGQYGSNGSYLVEGVHIQAGQDPLKMSWPRDLPWALFTLSSPQYFRTGGIRLLAGRDFTDRDQYDAPFAAIVSESLARQSFGSADPIGRRIYCGLDSPKPMTIVGVVSDVRQDSPASSLQPEIYMPFQQHPYFANELQIVIRTAGDPNRLVPDVRNSMHRLAPFMATRFTTFSQMVEDSMAGPRFRAALALAFAILAMSLALTGVYAMMSYYVGERRAEMGVRIALGATPGSIVSLVSRRALWLALVGLFIGIASAAALSRFAESMLYGLRSLDFAAYFMGAVTVLLVVAFAGAIPAWRASRVDPTVALRHE
ncbi:MAG TPA: ABC transporter permease [Bryobacteraceae bacterium]|jgi:predicted permease|nr:ABC transporter permease [Bryobacteraceae bacterium]